MKLPVEKPREPESDADREKDGRHSQEPPFSRERRDPEERDRYGESRIGQIELIVVQVQAIVLVLIPFSLRLDVGFLFIVSGDDRLICGNLLIDLLAPRR